MKDLDGLREINVLLKRLQMFNPNDRFFFFFLFYKDTGQTEITDSAKRQERKFMDNRFVESH